MKSQQSICEFIDTGKLRNIDTDRQFVLEMVQNYDKETTEVFEILKILSKKLLESLGGFCGVINDYLCMIESLILEYRECQDERRFAKGTT